MPRRNKILSSVDSRLPHLFRGKPVIRPRVFSNALHEPKRICTHTIDQYELVLSKSLINSQSGLKKSNTNFGFDPYNPD